MPHFCKLNNAIGHNYRVVTWPVLNTFKSISKQTLCCARIATSPTTLSLEVESQSDRRVYLEFALSDILEFNCKQAWKVDF